MRYTVGAVFLFTLILGGDAMALTLTSPAFNDGEMMDARYTCKAENLSPPLAWQDIPEGTMSFALICDDPDAPFVTWVHWVVYNIPVTMTKLDEGVPALAELAEGVKQGTNSFRKIGYGGPCPPPGKPHRYFFTLYALDAVLECDGGLGKGALLRKMEGHILDETRLIGLFKR